MDRLADKRDPLLVKIVRNLSMWTFNQQEVCTVVLCVYSVCVLCVYRAQPQHVDIQPAGGMHCCTVYVVCVCILCHGVNGMPLHTTAIRLTITLLRTIQHTLHYKIHTTQELESPELQYKYRGLWSPHIKVG